MIHCKKIKVTVENLESPRKQENLGDVFLQTGTKQQEGAFLDQQFYCEKGKNHEKRFDYTKRKVLFWKETLQWKNLTDSPALRILEVFLIFFFSPSKRCKKTLCII